MAFTPPFCPNSSCTNFHQQKKTGVWYFYRGSVTSRRDGSTKRYSCKQCGRTFRESTFSINYRVHHKLDYKRIFLSINSASGIRDIAREFKVTDKVILNRLARLARQAIGLQATLMRDHTINEDVAIDGFESFVHSQYWPNNYTITVGQESQFLYSCDYAQMRRKGRMTAFQKRKRDRLNTRYPIAGKQLESSFERNLNSLLLRWKPSPKRILNTDLKSEYAQVLLRNTGWQDSSWMVHTTTSSRRVRNTSNPLMPVNYFDREIRKDQANHVRQTVQWSKNVNNSMDRMMIYGVFHNFWKPFRIKERCGLTHAEVAGIESNRIALEKRRIFTRRYFFGKLCLDSDQWMTWLRLWKTPVSEKLADIPEYVCT